MKQYLTFSENETRNLAKRLAKRLRGVIALSGELGVGKTTFVQGFAKGLGIREKIISPSFVLIRRHKIPKSKKMLFHIDLYRLDDEKQFNDLGLKDLLNDLNNLIIIEWAQKAKKLLPKNTTYINFESLDKARRKITIQ